MTLRKAHGTGAETRTMRTEQRPLDEIPTPNAEDTAAGLAMRARRGHPFERGNTAARGRKPALASAAGIPLDAKDPAYKRALGQARRYRSRRVAELAVQHGGTCSAGVSAMLTSAAVDMAASRYLAMLAAKHGLAKLMVLSSKLATSARLHELGAVDLAEHEAAARAAARGPTLPAWMTTPLPEETPDGDNPKKSTPHTQEHDDGHRADTHDAVAGWLSPARRRAHP